MFGQDDVFAMLFAQATEPAKSEKGHAKAVPLPWHPIAIIDGLPGRRISGMKGSDEPIALKQKVVELKEALTETAAIQEKLIEDVNKLVTKMVTKLDRAADDTAAVHRRLEEEEEEVQEVQEEKPAARGGEEAERRPEKKQKGGGAGKKKTAAPAAGGKKKKKKK